MTFKAELLALSLLAAPGYSQNSLECYDAYECAGQNIYADVSVFCHALKSCYDTNFTLDDGRTPQPYGELSLANSMVYMTPRPDEDNDDPYTYSFSCHGDRSCSMTYFYPNDQVNFYANAHLDLYGSLINATDDAWRTRFYLYGAYSGYNTTINCYRGTCYLYCEGTGCTGLKLYEPYDSSDESNEMYEYDNFEIDCTYSEYNEFCPYGYDLGMYADYIPNLAETMNGPFSTYNNSRGICTNFPNNTFLPDLKCCTKESSCEEEDVELQADPSGANETGIAIRCDGRYACDSDAGTSVETQYILRSTDGGDIYATGHQAAEFARIETDMESNVICTGEQSCQRSVIVSGNNVYGTGFESLKRSTIRNVNNVYCYSHEACYQMNATNIYQNVYCVGTDACDAASITGAANVYSNGYQVLGATEISDISGTVLGAGYEALVDTNIQNVDTVVCIGYQACYETTMSGVRVINATGYEVLERSSITSNLGGGTFELYINSTERMGGFSITCSDGDTCLITCTYEYVCDDLNCDGACTIDLLNTPAPTEPSLAPTPRPSSQPTAPTKAPNVGSSSNRINQNINMLFTAIFVMFGFILNM